MSFRASCMLATLVLLAGCSRTGLGLDDGDEDAGLGVIPCTPGTFTLTKAVPAVMFVIDRSGSMDDLLMSEHQPRWLVLTDALSSSLPPVDDTMEIGALLFPNSSGSGNFEDNQACVVAGSANLGLATGHVPALLALMEQTAPGGGTPTADAMGVAAQLLLGVRAATTARAIVLATDGAPNCNASLDSHTCTCADENQGDCFREPLECLDDTRTVQAIASYTSQGLPTYVIGIQDEGDTQNTEVLDEMATAGGRPQTGAATSYYAASSEADLDTALVAIRDQVGACTFLTTSVPGADGSISVSAGGTVVPYDPTGKSGWSWGDKGNGQIVFAGSTCTSVTNANVALTALVACTTPDASTP